QRFLDSITSIVKQAVEKSVSAMVVSGLSRQSQPLEEAVEPEQEIDEKALLIDPENSKIVTTYTERLLFDYIVLILGEDAEIDAKDTESYFTVLYKGKTNRWLLRYFDNKQRPSITVPLELAEVHKAEIQRAGLEISGSNIIIDRPENILRISGLIKDCLEYCEDDNNFSRKK
ncbi:MAG TPA: hypothetical protein VK109_06110, partial [Enterococcus sp.]|nr:hypothetical protein [Enterococcus sp.]